MHLKKLWFITICGILFFSGMVKVTGQASTGQEVFPWWNYDPRNDPRIQEMQKFFTGYYDVQWKLWTFEELRNESKTLKKLADEFNNTYKTNAGVAIRVHTQLYTLSETNPEKQIFAVIVVTGVLKEGIKP